MIVIVIMTVIAIMIATVTIAVVSGMIVLATRQGETGRDQSRHENGLQTDFPEIHLRNPFLMP